MVILVGPRKRERCYGSRVWGIVGLLLELLVTGGGGRIVSGLGAKMGGVKGWGVGILGALFGWRLE